MPSKKHKPTMANGIYFGWGIVNSVNCNCNCNWEKLLIIHQLTVTVTVTDKD